MTKSPSKIAHSNRTKVIFHGTALRQRMKNKLRGLAAEIPFARIFHPILKTLGLIFLVSTLTSCALSPAEKRIQAQELARSSGFKTKIVKGGKFDLTTFYKETSQGLPYVIYIEGDGDAFRRGALNSDPTPGTQMLLKLASMDTRPNVVYLARPCQYIEMNQFSRCDSAYWSDKRFSEDSVEAMNEAIHKITGNSLVDLVGFSGGGGIAVLVAARNKNVRSIITVAGNLDHVEFNKIHRTKPMKGSLNPVDYAKKVSHIPQLHLSGGEDKVVPAIIADNFIKASSPSNCIQRKIIKDTTHTKHWENHWKSVLATELKCR